MEDISQMRKGRLVVGSLPITGAHVLPLVLPVFQERYPEIDVVLVEETTRNLEHLTASGQADISLLSLPLFDDALAYEPVIEEEIVLAVPPQHPLAAKAAEAAPGEGGDAWTDPLRPLSGADRSVQPVDIGLLRNEPFIALKKGQASGKSPSSCAAAQASRRTLCSKAATSRRCSRSSPPAWASLRAAHGIPRPLEQAGACLPAAAKPSDANARSRLPQRTLLVQGGRSVHGDVPRRHAHADLTPACH